MARWMFVFGVIFTIIIIANSGSKEQESAGESKPFQFSAGSGPFLEYQTVKINSLKKGGSINPPLAPKYTLLIVSSLVPEKESYKQQFVENTLRKIVSETVSQYQPDGVTVRLYHNAQNLEKNTNWIAEGDWWPKGHSFNPSNEEFIKAKDWHVFTPKYNLPRSVPEDRQVVRLPIKVRKQIYAELFESEMRASRKARKRFPTDTPEQVSRNMNKVIDEEDRLIAKYKKEIMAKYQITEDEKDKISEEGVDSNWPQRPSE